MQAASQRASACGLAAGCNKAATRGAGGQPKRRGSQRTGGVMPTRQCAVPVASQCGMATSGPAAECQRGGP
eukprot:10703200-Alexandrium_andersonii.AAC.1